MELLHHTTTPKGVKVICSPCLRPDPDFFPLLVGQALCFAVLSLALRLLGLHLVTTDAGMKRPGPFQFSLMDILSWTTATAVLAAFFKCLPKGVVEFMLPAHPTIGIIIVYVANGGCAVVGLASIWLVFGGRWLIVRCLACAGAVALAGYVVLGAGASRKLLYFVFLFAAQAGWLVASLLAIRFAGFRLVWQWRFGRYCEEDPQPSDSNENCRGA